MKYLTILDPISNAMLVRQLKDVRLPEQEQVLRVLVEVDPLELVQTFYSFTQTTVQDFKLGQRLFWWHL